MKQKGWLWGFNMTIISDTAKVVINKNREWKKMNKKLKDQDVSLDEYFLGKDPRKTKYYKTMMKKK